MAGLSCLEHSFGQLGYPGQEVRPRAFPIGSHPTPEDIHDLLSKQTEPKNTPYNVLPDHIFQAMEKVFSTQRLSGF